MADKYLLEDGSGGYLLEDGSGVLLLETGGVKCLYNISQFRAGFAQVRAGLQAIEDELVCALGGGSFLVDGVRMETGDWISSAVNWSDSPTGSLVCFVNLTPGTGAYMPLMGPDGYSDMVGFSGFDLSGSTYFFDSTETNYVYDEPASASYSEGVWFPVFVDWKTDETAGNKILQVYYGDTNVGTGAQDEGTGSFSVTWTGQTLLIGKSGSNEFDGNLAEFWLDTTRIDFSVEANRRKFYSADGKPVDVGSDGSTPTGSAPRVYLSVRPGDTAADFVTNRGTGNDFTQNGTLTLSSTSPSD